MRELAQASYNAIRPSCPMISPSEDHFSESGDQMVGLSMNTLGPLTPSRVRTPSRGTTCLVGNAAMRFHAVLALGMVYLSTPTRCHNQAELQMPGSRLKKVEKAVPTAKKKSAPVARAGTSAQSPPATQSDFSVGDSISHPKFGNGIVTAIDGDKLTIEFDGKVTKQIVDYYVKHR
jgi:hypothetical protein